MLVLLTYDKLFESVDFEKVFLQCHVCIYIYCIYMLNHMLTLQLQMKQFKVIHKLYTRDTLHIF